MNFPQAAPRSLEDIWRSPRGLARATAVNHKIVGKRYVLTGFAFFLVAGVLALLMRTQLAVPENDFLSYAQYNRLFTMHGTTMMFLFAVPIVEGMAIYLLPLMIGARDLAFPRLSAFGYWCYLFGGLLLYSSFLVHDVPDAGWFMYTPLSGPEYSPGKAVDFWLLGVTFVEISTVAAAVELAVSILRTRAPGMSIDRMPIFAWYMLVVAFMILLGFPALILGSILLELERSFHMPFYDPDLGGNPLVWQHLFWIFGHPEVYIIFLPAAGFVSMIVPTFARRAIAGYPWVVLAVVGTGFVSLGLWVHHMFATGLPGISLGFFSAASMTVSVLSGIQIFAWLATLWLGRPVLKTPLLFVCGFIFIFVLGGLTGVMVAVVPFDWQVHDSYFVVAHFHYVLIGGMVFPLFGAFYYWLPAITGRMLSESLGIGSFLSMFAGFNLAFFPMHLSGMLGMPRRVFTYPSGLGWDTPNLLSTIGAFVFAFGVLLFVVNFLWSLRYGRAAGENPWNAGTLEWIAGAPAAPFNFRSLPEVSSRYPVWDDPAIARKTRARDGLLADPGSGLRLTAGTSNTTGELNELIVLPKPTWLPLAAALATGIFFVSFLVGAYAWSAAGAAAALALFVLWAWHDPARRSSGPVAFAKRTGIPVRPEGTSATAWWGLVIALVGDAVMFLSLLFAYFYTWSTARPYPPGPEWQPLGAASLSLGALAAGTLGIYIGQRALRRGRRGAFLGGFSAAALFGAVHLGLAAWALPALSFGPTEGALAAMLFAIAGYALFHSAVALVMALFALARGIPQVPDDALGLVCGITGLFWYYTAGVALLAAAVLFFAPAWR